jgi:hypothetical protein
MRPWKEWAFAGPRKEERRGVPRNAPAFVGEVSGPYEKKAVRHPAAKAAAGLYLALLARVALRRLGSWRRDDQPDAGPFRGLSVAALLVRGGLVCGRG